MSFSILADRPVAVDSPDHLDPKGTAHDDNRNMVFQWRVEALLPTRPLRIMDVGCSGGGMIEEFVEAGHLAVGIEGSDYSRKIGRAAWGRIPGKLFTADATYPFRVLEDGQPFLCDLITSWDFLEHVRETDLPMVFANFSTHLKPDGLLIFNINTSRCGEWHQTVRPKSWWLDCLRDLGYVNHPNLVDWFGWDWVRGPYQTSPPWWIDHEQNLEVVLTRSGERQPCPPPDWDMGADRRLSAIEYCQRIGNHVYAEILRRDR